MFAPITRSYSSPFAAEASEPPALPPFERNQLEFPRDPQLNLAFLKTWQQCFDGDSFDFDYHFMWDHFKDPGQHTMARVLHQDIARLQQAGLNGFVSCQVQRAFFPTGLGMTVLGRTLWDRDLDLDAIVRDYFQAAFGKHWEAAEQYLTALSELFNPKLLRGEATEEERAQAPEKLARVPNVVADFRPTIRKGMRSAEPCHARSWRYLDLHAEVCIRLSRALHANLLGKQEQATNLAWELFNWVRRNERYLHRVFDVYEFQLVMAPILGLPREDVLNA